MKHKSLWALAAILCILPACNSSSGTYYAFKSSSNGKWGMISPQGKVMFDNEFKKKPTDATGGIFFARTGKDDTWQIYDVSNITAPVSDKSYEAILPFNEDVTLARKGSKGIKILNKKGEEVAALDKLGEAPVKSATAFSDGISVVYTQLGFGAVNTKGEIVLKPKYGVLVPLGDGMLMGIDNKFMDEDEDDMVCSVINKSGETLFTFKLGKYCDVKGYSKGLLAVRKKEVGERKWGFIDKKGEEVIKPTTKNANIGEWNNAVYVYSNDDLWGLKRITDDEQLIRCKYDRLQFADKEGTLLWAGEWKDNGYQWSLVNRDGEVLSSDTYKDHKTFEGDFCPAQVSDKEWVFINRKGQEQKIKVDISSIGGYSLDDTISNKEEVEENEIIGDGGAPYDNSYYSSGSSYSGVPGIYPEGSTRYLTEYDLMGKSLWDLKVMRNEIYGRHGYLFKSQDLIDYFSMQPWYYGYEADAKVAAREFSDIETANVQLIKSYEKQLKHR